MQLLARHKDATTTLKHYIKCKDKAELAGVVSALPALMVSTPQNENKKGHQEGHQNIQGHQEGHQNLEALGYLESSQESEIENISESQVVDSSVVYGVLPGEIGSALDGNRTCNLRFRRPMLYPVELQVHLFQCYKYRTEKPRSQRIGYIYKHETSGKCWKSLVNKG